MINTTTPDTIGLPLGRGRLVENSSIHPPFNQVWFGEVCLVTFVVRYSIGRSTVSSVGAAHHPVVIVIAAAAFMHCQWNNFHFLNYWQALDRIGGMIFDLHASLEAFK